MGTGEKKRWEDNREARKEETEEHRQAGEKKRGTSVSAREEAGGNEEAGEKGEYPGRGKKRQGKAERRVGEGECPESGRRKEGGGKRRGEDRREAMKKEGFCARNSDRYEIRRSGYED